MPTPALQLPVNRASLPSLFYPTNPFLPSAATAAAVRGGIRRGRHGGGRGICCSAEKAAPSLVSAERRPVAVKAVVTVLQTIGGEFAHLGWTRGLDDITDLRGRTLLLELISAELDPKTGSERKGVEAFARRVKHGLEQETYEASFSVPAGFGEIGAVYVKNEHHEEMYIRDIILDIGSGDGEDGDGTTLTFSCRSWVASKFVSPEPRVFFPSNKSYLPYETPSGLLRARAEELVALRGNGTGERKKYDRIYDYATYDDLGDPDLNPDLTRPVLGGNKEYPYPRRCRTGRPMSKRDPQAEVRGSEYVPRDENFSEIKNESFSVKTLRSVVHMLLPSLKTAMVDTKLGFPYFTAIDTLFDEGMPLPKDKSLLQVFRDIVPRLIKAVEQGADSILQFEVPEMIERDTFSWFRDEEFSRQTLAGLNPLTIQLVTEFPFVSKLDPKIYGPPESLITKELIEREIKEKMTVEEALKQKKLFILDYYDLFLPYVHKIREIEGTTLYASRTVFFLTQQGTLQPIAIELTRPASPTKPQWKEVFTPCWDATGTWLWRLAKTHAVAHDTGFHQLVSHWLRTHCCVEPYVIATNRQLSQMHPINRLLHPHFRYTMEINALARMYLINAGGIIEDTFFPRKYSMEISSVVYGKLWRFDMEALPNDLIRRGMAVEDPQAEHGLKLTIEDYPYAQDGLLIWKAIEQWVSDYVNHYYQTAAQVKEDTELQAWWTEVRTRGHGDKKDEPWWPVLNSQADLIQVLCTIIWVASCHHAAVNFGQYQYGGYFPNRPTIARTNMPVEDGNEAEMARFMEKPESTMLRTFPSQIQATLVMAILDVLSSHSPDEEYMGTDAEPAWELNPLINAAFERFSGRMKEIEGIIDAKNRDTSLKNRCGAGIVPYELLKPFSKPGVTGMGVPKSISI